MSTYSSTPMVCLSAAVSLRAARCRLDSPGFILSFIQFPLVLRMVLLLEVTGEATGGPGQADEDRI